MWSSIILEKWLKTVRARSDSRMMAVTSERAEAKLSPTAVEGGSSDSGRKNSCALIVTTPVMRLIERIVNR
jgi:hypothetical protein